jgi:hypothetical protein
VRRNLYIHALFLPSWNIWVGSTRKWRQNPVSKMSCFQIKDKMMDNVQNCDSNTINLCLYSQYCFIMYLRFW